MGSRGNPPLLRSRWITSLPLAITPMVLLCACDLINPYEKPATETPESFVERTEAAGWPAQDWWKNFGSNELNALEQQAEAGNHDFAAAIARVRQADAQVSITGAPLLPSLDAELGATRTHSGGNSTSFNNGITTTTTSGSRNRSNYSAALQASYEIDFWGKNRSALTAAEAARDAQLYDQQIVALSIRASVATVYFDILATRERIAVAQDNISNAKKTLGSLQKRFDVGLISRLEVAQQASVVAEQSAALAPLQLKLSQDRDALATLVGMLPETLELPTGMKLAALKTPTVPAGLPSELLTRRPDIAQAEADLVAAHANINVARAAFFPSIGLTASGGYQSDALDSLFKSGGQLFSFGASLVQPIFEGGALIGQLDYSKARYDELAQNYFQTVVAAFADTENALAGVQRSGEQLQAQAQLLHAARDAFQLSQRQFDGGIVDITSVLNTQRALFSAQDGYLQVRLQQLNATATLYQALGGGWSQQVP